MTLVVPNSADLQMLRYVFNRSTTLHLYSNNLTPSKTTVLSDITEASGSGYSAISLTGSSWTFATNTGINQASYAQQTFTITGAITIYGYYITSTDGLLYVEKFPTTYILPDDGGEIIVNPLFNLN